MRRAKHLIILAIESFRADVFRNPALSVPSLQKLSDSGFRFAGCHSPAVATAPAHAAILTGQLPPSNSIRHHFPGRLPGSSLTLFERLRKSGFFTTARADFVNDLQSADLLRGVHRLAASDLEACDLVQRARRDGKRTFLYFQLGDLHPWAKNETAAKRRGSPLNRYFKRVEEFDRGHFERLLKKLLEAKLLDETILFVVGSHGEASDPKGRFGHGEIVTEEAIRVPWIVCSSLPQFRHGESETPVSLVDLVPTALGLLGVRPSRANCDGEDRSRFLLGADRKLSHSSCYAEGWHYEAQYWKKLHSLAAVFKGPASLESAPNLLEHLSMSQQTLRVKSLKLVLNFQKNKKSKARLYDLESDPQERRDLLKHPSGKLSRAGLRIRHDLQKWRSLSEPTAEKPGQRTFAHFPLHFQRRRKSEEK